MNRVVPVVMVGLITLACTGPLDAAYTLGATDPEGALELVEAHLEASPDDAQGLEALGDMHLNAMGSPAGDVSHAEAAVAAYARLIEVQPRRGGFKAKLALAQRLAGVDHADLKAASAWDCCRNASAIALVDEPRVLEAVVSGGPWTPPTDWFGLPGYDGGTPGRLVVRSEAATIQSDAGPAPVLARGTAADVIEISDQVTFFDRSNPSTESTTGFVLGKLCDQPHEGFACRKRTVRRTEIHGGPCWHSEDPSELDQVLVDPETVDWTRVRCVPGKPTAQAEACPDVPGSCAVTYDALTYAKVRVPKADVWLLPGDGPTPESILVWSTDVAGIDVSERLAAGQLAVGLPEPLVRWAARSTPDALPDGWSMTRDHTELVWRSDAGTFTVLDGVLAGWDPAN